MGKIKEKENLEFRVFLKGWDRPQDELDKHVQTFYHKFAAKMDCLTCENCCKELNPVLTEKDIKRLANAMGISIEEFEGRYVMKDETWGVKSFKESPCPLLHDNHCQFYEFRPKDCKSFPFLHKPFFAFRLSKVIKNYSICPIVFNVYESLKKKFWQI